MRFVHLRRWLLTAALASATLISTVDAQPKDNKEERKDRRDDRKDRRDDKSDDRKDRRDDKRNDSYAEPTSAPPPVPTMVVRPLTCTSRTEMTSPVSTVIERPALERS